MTLCELLTMIKFEYGGTYEIAINRNGDMPTFNYSTIYDTIDEWIDGFKYANVWWADRNNVEYDGDLDDLHTWETELLFSEAKLMTEVGPYEEPACHWIDVDL